MAEVQKDSDRIITRWGRRWRTQNCTAWSSESLTANTSVWISLTSSKACWLLLYKKKNLVNPTEIRTTTWQGINPLDNGIMVPQRAWTPAKPVPDLSLFWLCRHTMAMLIFFVRRRAKQLFFLSLPFPSEVTGATAQDIIPKLRQPLHRLESRSHFHPKGHQDTKEPSTVDGEWPSQPRPHLTPHHLSPEKLSTHARHIESDVHTHLGV